MRKTICIFDLDDTLVKTGAKIKVYEKDTGDLLHSLTPQQYNDFDNSCGHVLDFNDFDDLQVLLKGSLMISNIKILLELSKSYSIGIITARSHIDSVLEFVYENKLPIEKHLIFAVNDERSSFFGNVAERKKQAFERLIKIGYNNFIYYDDNLDNLLSAKSLESEYDNIKIKLHHVKG